MIQNFDNRRDYVIAGDAKETISWAAEHWIHTAQRAIQRKGRFAVALSGGSTPKAIYDQLRKKNLDWSKVLLFWSDERAVAPDHPESNYRMAMESLGALPIPPSQIYRMTAEEDIDNAAFEYEEKIQHLLGKDLFDLVMLGVGTDGHTASLFPNTSALHMTDRLVVSNYLPEAKTWRMTLTFTAIERSAHTCIYAIGPSKQSIVSKVLKAPVDSEFPASKIGRAENKALWVLDEEAAKQLF